MNVLILIFIPMSVKSVYYDPSPPRKKRHAGHFKSSKPVNMAQDNVAFVISKNPLLKFCYVHIHNISYFIVQAA